MKKMLLLTICLNFSILIANAQRAYTKEMIEKYRLNYSPPMKKFKFSKLKDKSFPLSLDSNAVYVIKNFDSEIKDSVISFIRFYGNNICFSSHPYKSYPNEEEFKQTDYGSWCMYKVKDENIVLEFYETLNVPPDFFYSYGTIKNNSIMWYKVRFGRSPLVSSHKLNNADFMKKMNFTDFTINWK